MAMKTEWITSGSFEHVHMALRESTGVQRRKIETMMVLT